MLCQRQKGWSKRNIGDEWHFSVQVTCFLLGIDLDLWEPIRLCMHKPLGDIQKRGDKNSCLRLVSSIWIRLICPGWPCWPRIKITKHGTVRPCIFCGETRDILGAFVGHECYLPGWVGGYLLRWDLGEGGWVGRGWYLDQMVPIQSASQLPRHCRNSLKIQRVPAMSWRRLPPLARRGPLLRRLLCRRCIHQEMYVKRALMSSTIAARYDDPLAGRTPVTGPSSSWSGRSGAPAGRGSEHYGLEASRSADPPCPTSGSLPAADGW